MIAKTRRIFRWRSRFRRPRVCSLLWLAEGRKIFLHVLHRSYYFLRRRQSWNNLNLIKDTFLFIRSSLDNFCLFFFTFCRTTPALYSFFCHENIGRRVEGKVPVCPQGRFLIFNQISVMHAKIKGRDLPALYSAWFDHSDKILVVQLSPGCWKI